MKDSSKIDGCVNFKNLEVKVTPVPKPMFTIMDCFANIGGLTGRRLKGLRPRTSERLDWRVHFKGLMFAF